VTVRAEGRRSRLRGSRTRFLTVGVLAGAIAAPASAEMGTTFSVFSDLRFRGYSLSEGRPVAILDFAYDDPSGFYADAAGTAVIVSDPGPLGLQVTGGYAKRLKSGTTLDLGITHSTYSHYSSAARGSSYTEIYAGITRGALSSRIFLSPHYFEQGRWSAYGEVNASVSPLRKWSVDGHVGIQVPLRTPSDESYRPEFDWRVGVNREVGRLSLRAAWSAGAPGHDYYRGERHSRSVLVVGASLAL